MERIQFVEGPRGKRERESKWLQTFYLLSSKYSVIQRTGVDLSVFQRELSLDAQTFRKEKESDRTGARDGLGSSQNWPEGAAVGLRERGEELQRLPSLPSPLWILTWRTWPYDTPPERSGGKEDRSSLEQSTGGAKRAREDFLSSSVWYKGRAGLSPLPKCAKVRTV